MKKQVNTESIVWTTMAHFSCSVVKDNVRLGIVCQPYQDKWQVLAIEVSKNASSVEDVFEAHAHKVVGSYDSPTESLKAAESFARAWLKNHQSASFKETCDCKEIASI